MQDTGLSFSKAERLTNNAAQHLFLLVFITINHSGQLYRWDHLELVQRAAMCVPAVAEPPDFEIFGLGHGQAEAWPSDLALFFPACPQPGINLPEGWSSIPMSKCSCLAYAINVA